MLKLHEASFSTGSAVDAAAFRALLDSLFHSVDDWMQHSNCPSNAAGLMEPNDYAREIWSVLSRHTYRDGKQGCTDARTILKERDIELSQ